MTVGRRLNNVKLQIVHVEGKETFLLMFFCLCLQLTEEMASPASEAKADKVLKPSLVPDAAAPGFPGIPPTTHATLPELKQPLTQPHNTFRNHVSVYSTLYLCAGAFSLLLRVKI